MGHWEGYTDRRYSLRQAADDGQLVIVRCGLCRRTTHFLATDLVTMFDPNRSAYEPAFGCSNCKRDDYISVKLRMPATGDYGDLLVRRPGPVKRIQTWVTVRLGD